METIPIAIENVSKAKDYLNSIGKLQKFNDKGVDPSQWSAVILFANEQILEQNQNNKSNG